MKKTLQASSLLLACFFILQLFALSSFAITFNRESYSGMDGRLIPNWYWQYENTKNTSFMNGTYLFINTYITHFFIYSASLSITPNATFNGGEYDVIIGPSLRYSRWWPSMNSNPNDEYAVYELSSSSSGFIMGPNATYVVPCFNETHNDACLKSMIYEVSVKNTLTNDIIISEVYTAKYDS